MNNGADFTIQSLLLNADPVVQAVMAALALASIACWAIIIEKAVVLGRLKREARTLTALAATGGIVPPEGEARGEESMSARVLRVGLPEWREGRDTAETAGEFRDRLERTMRVAVTATLRKAEPGLPLLATIGSVSPFVGLFGTVWGIMHSFFGIAAKQDTGLATVAPGIAEALFATAIGLVAAIPAVIAYNRCSVQLSRIRQEAGAAAASLASRLARRPAIAGGRRAAGEPA
ncbi:MotA/TolQ/ExbB proton channel family protein [Paeniroseomonas aquatica]|uniref:MotA/TolQ/ExbB proton channel family protein n=1 Tax=Paeniroseomonas aquatica TaxID=373043 RepID=A0ABT8AFG8_9PROT|nr:MotA/TolQ/ExbB proton channel family protein [Paeniroseomonas aquatica]MDN3568301.1 MotA/TolQ/ExbB proton channel family protein [Paeniroseomonas aquatica]